MEIARGAVAKRRTSAGSTPDPRVAGSPRLFPALEPRSSVTRSIVDFGAIGDGITINTTQLQKAIDHVAKDGGGVVVVPKGAYVSGSILLKSHVTLHLSAGATLLGSLNPADYRAEDSFLDATNVMRGFALIAAVNAREVGITGEGVIDGRGVELQRRGCWPNAKPFLVRWVRCNEVRVSGVTLQNASSRTMHAFQSKDVAYKDVEVYSYGLENNIGFDIDSCEQVRISRCILECQDDGISIKTTSKRACRDVEVSHCTVRTHHDALKIGTASFGDLEDIRIHHCNVIEAREGAVRICSENGARIRRVTVADLHVQRADIPIFVRLRGRLPSFREDEPSLSIGSISSIAFKNISVSDIRRMGIVISGAPGHRIEEVTLEDLCMRIKGEGAASRWGDDLSVTPEQQASGYSEVWRSEPVGAYGGILRHAVCIKIENLELNVESSEERAALICDDLHNSSVEGMQLTGQPRSQTVAVLRNSRNIVLTRLTVPDSSQVLIRVQGAHCGHLQLADTPIPDSAAAFCFEEGASEGMACLQTQA